MAGSGEVAKQSDSNLLKIFSKLNQIFLCFQFFFNFQAQESKTRFIVFKIDKVGAVGESILHLCSLIASDLHIGLAKRIIKIFPKLINDIYMANEYYGKKKKKEKWIFYIIRLT